MEAVFEAYFSDLFETSEVDEMQHVIDLVKCNVTDI